MKAEQNRYRAKVIRGYGRGKILGFPTLNLKTPERFPYRHGIYAGYVWLRQKKYRGAFHYGPTPTYGRRKASLEVFLLNRRRDVAEAEVSFQMVHYLRPIVAFDSEIELSEQICRDVDLAKTMLAS